MRAGRLRHQVVLEKKNEAPNVAGSLDATFATVETVWGELTALRGGRYVYGVPVERVATHELLLRWRGDFRAAWDHVQIDGQRYQVHEVKDPDGRREQLVAQLEELGVPA